MDFEISPGDIDRTHRIGVPGKGKNRPIIIKFVKYMDRRRVFTNKKRLKEKNMSITVSLTKIRMSALKEARSKFRYSNVWTADGKITYKEEGDAKAKVYFDWYSGKQCCVTEKQELFLILMALFLFVCRIFYEAFQNRKLLCHFNTFYRHTYFN